jgi:hypothetical protein
MKAYVGISLAQETFTATFLAEAGPLCCLPPAKTLRRPRPLRA